VVYYTALFPNFLLSMLQGSNSFPVEKWKAGKYSSFQNSSTPASSFQAGWQALIAKAKPVLVIRVGRGMQMENGRCYGQHFQKLQNNAENSSNIPARNAHCKWRKANLKCTVLCFCSAQCTEQQMHLNINYVLY